MSHRQSKEFHASSWTWASVTSLIISFSNDTSVDFSDIVEDRGERVLLRSAARVEQSWLSTQRKGPLHI